MTTTEKLHLLREKMKERSLDAYYIPSADPHMSEYLPENYKTRAFISGFTGSAGDLLVLKDEAFLWTDGRYFLQAEKQLKGSSIKLQKMGEAGVPSIPDFLAKQFPEGARLGLDGKTFSLYSFKAFNEKNPKLEFVSEIDLVAEIWENRPQASLSQAFILDEKYCGESASSKIKRFREKLFEKEIDASLICSLDDVCYLYNIRAHDVHCNPVLTSYALVDSKRAILFANKKQISDELKKKLLSEGVTVLEYEEVFNEAGMLRGTILLDPTSTNFYLFNKIKAKVVLDRSFTVDMKACKNKTEIENIRKTMLLDGIALSRFLYWLSKNIENEISETDVVKKLHDFRAEGEGYIDESFDTISAYAENAAIVHYSAIKGEDKKLKPKGFLLLDSGAHYYTGTSDITRTIPLGTLTDEECEDYTIVLKSHIRLAMAQFKEGTTGFALDTISRLPLWENAKDYNHGTGHGVGFVLSVHEGPQSISQRYKAVAMKEGMLTSNEPGIYIEGKHGIRIESLILTKLKQESEFGRFFNFETVTLCPISTKPVKKDLLSQSEINWLNKYNARCYELLSKHLKAEEKEFLKNECKSI